MATTPKVAWGVGIGLIAALVVGLAMQRMGYEFLAAGASLLTVCVVSCCVGVWLRRKQE